MSDSPDVYDIEHARAEKAAKRRLERESQITETILESTNEGFVIWDSEYRLVAWSKKCPDFWYAPEDILRPGMPMVDLLHHIAANGGLGPGDSEELAQNEFKRVREAGSNSNDEFELRDGRVISVLRNSMPDGGHASTYTDITQRRRAEKALRESEEQYRSLVEGSIQGVAIDRDGVPIFVNQAYADIFGYDNPDEVVELGSLSPLYEPEEHARVGRYRKNRMAGHQPAPEHYEFSGIKKDGSKINLETRLLVVAWQGDLAVQSTVIDITERKRAEQAYIASEQKYRQAAELANMGHWIWDEIEDRIIHCSDELAQIHGVSAEEYVAITSSLDQDKRWVHPDDRERYRAAVTGSINSGEDFNIEYRIVRRDGEIRDVRAIGKPEFDENNLVIRSHGTVQDISQLRQMEDALRESEQRFRSLFEQSPIGVSVEDYSGVKDEIDRLRDEGVDDLEMYLNENPDVLFDLVWQIDAVDANDSFLKLFRVDSFQEYLDLDNDFEHWKNSGWREYYAKELINLANGKPHFGEFSELASDGTPIELSCVARVLDGHGDDWSLKITTHEDITERKQIVEALRESEQRFRALFDQSPFGISVEDYSQVKKQIDRFRSEGVDDFEVFFRGNDDALIEVIKSTRLIDANETQTEMFGTASLNEYKEYERDDVVLTSTWKDFYRREIIAFAGGANTYTGETMDYRADGTPIDVRCVSRIINNPNDDWSVIVSTHEDITERKRIEEARLEAESRFQAIVNASPAAISLKDRDGVYLLANKTFAEWTLTDPSQVIGRTAYDFLPEAQAAAVEDEDRYLTETGEQTVNEATRSFPDGIDRTVLVNRCPIRKADGNIHAIATILTDITDRKQMEEALRESETLLNSIFENVPVGLLIKDASHVVEKSNRAYLDWYGLDADAMAGRRSDQIEDFQSTEEADFMNAQEIEVLTKGQIQTRQVERPFADGQTHTVSITKFPVHDQERKITKVGSVSVDLTEQVQARAALAKSEEKHRRFAADVAHELRTPLAVLRTQLDNLKNESIKQSLIPDVDALTHLVERILAMARLDSVDIHSGERADLLEICSVVAANLGPLVLRAGRSLEVIGVKTPLIVKGNAEALEQALRNLVENAIRHADPGSTITIDITDDPSIKVINLGTSIPLEQRETIFQRFERADRLSGGAGLGLSIVKRVVEAHDGSVDITDAPGGGTVFTIRLPRNRLESTDA